MINLIEQWIVYRGWTKSEFARRANIKSSTVTNLTKSGRMPQNKTIAKYAKIFGVTAQQFKRGPQTFETSPPETESLEVNMDDADRLDKIIDIAGRLDSGNLKMLLVYALYLESKNTQSNAKKNMHSAS